MKNDVITRIGPSYGYSQATDVYGNQASARWEPRVCNKGLALNRRVYGPRRVNNPMQGLNDQQAFLIFISLAFYHSGLGVLAGYLEWRLPQLIYQRINQYQTRKVPIG